MVDMSTVTLSLILNGRGFAAALPLASTLSQSEAPYGHPGLPVLCPAHPDGRRLSQALETELVLLTLLYFL